MGDANPNRVVEVKSEKYSDRLIISREDSIVLYACSEIEPRFEIIMHRPCSESLSQAFRCLFFSISIILYALYKL